MAALAGILSSVLAFLGVVSCCGMPVLAAVLATLGVGASQLNFFNEYRVWFLLFALVMLAYGFYQAYFKKESNCCCQSDCSDETEQQPKKRKWYNIFLWIGLIITILALFMGNQEENVSESDGCCPSAVQQEQPKIQSGCCQPTTSVEVQENCCSPR